VKIDFVQIAGSNGKGSTARMLENILQTAGFDVGLFTSPALYDVREQIRVNGQKISKERVIDYIEHIQPRVEWLRSANDTPTQFELITALAIHHFNLEEVDIAILEVGIGGRYDATSVVDPVASAVTSVSLEHTNLLGDTVEEIAHDMAEVAPKENSLVTAASGNALTALQNKTSVMTVGSTDSDILVAEDILRSAVKNNISISGRDWSLQTQISLLGRHQAMNAGIAATLAKQIAEVDSEVIAEGLQDVTWPGRFEIVATDPMVVLDGAHNPEAASALSDLLARYSYDDLHVVFAAMSDKDYEQMIKQLPSLETAFITRPDTDRAEDMYLLARAFDGHANDIRKIGNVLEATEQALSLAKKTDLLLVTGSLYNVAEARTLMGRRLLVSPQQ
jgi:dihydropteroate synthase